MSEWKDYIVTIRYKTKDGRYRYKEIWIDAVSYDHVMDQMFQLGYEIVDIEETDREPLEEEYE